MRSSLHLRVEEAPRAGAGHWDKRQNTVSLHRPLLAGEVACRPEQAGIGGNHYRRLGGLPRPHPRQRPCPRTARARPPRPRPLAGTRSCGGARVHPNPPPSGSGGDARPSRPPCHQCQPPLGDSICFQGSLAAAQAGGERCPPHTDDRPLRQAAAHSPAVCGGDTRSLSPRRNPGSLRVSQDVPRSGARPAGRGPR